VIRKILVPVRGDGKGDNVLGHAAALAHRHTAHVKVIHCRARPEDLMPYGVHLPEYLRKQIIAQSHLVADQEEEGLRAELEALAKAYELDSTGKQLGNVATVEFVEEAGRQVDVIKRHGRLCDIIAVAQPDLDRNLGHNTLKAALFHSGRPVLMCPPATTAPKALGANVAIAWNASAEAARALSQCKSVLRGADKVWVLSNGEDSGSGTSATDLIGYLSLHNIHAVHHEFPKSRNVGKALLTASEELGLDMLIMGAYGDSHEKETIFGGNTQTIVDTAKIAVLLNY